jgi:TrmH family RNA methyltransferase
LPPEQKVAGSTPAASTISNLHKAPGNLISLTVEVSDMSHFPKITSPDNKKLKLARAVRDLREKDLLFIEGIRLSAETLKTELPIEFALIAPSLPEKAPGADLCRRLVAREVEIFEIDEKVFASVADTKTPQGIILIARKPATGQKILDRRLGPAPLLLLIHQMNNPNNLGAILRTAEAAGVDGIITTRGSADIFSPKSLRGGMGANLRLPFWADADFDEALDWARANGLRSICADIRSHTSYLDVDWRIPRLLILGSEGHGLSAAERELADESLIIPMLNDVESLNVAVAGGILLFEAKKQREGK